MIRKTKTFAAAVLWVSLYCIPGWGQAPPPTILEIDLENRVQYFGDISDVSKLATDPNVTNPVPSKNFVPVLIIADIVAVNGQPAKGTSLFHIRQINLRTAPNAGEAIADIVRNNVVEIRFELLKADGTPLGTIMASGLGGGVPPPGAPSTVRVGNVAIVGGTGAFLGARGQVGQGVTTTPDRSASMAEDPANRRTNGGGKVRYVLELEAMFRPEVVVTHRGPVVTHSSDASLLSTSRPAAVGEILSAFVTGLGPVLPSVDPGKPFPASPLAVVNSPVEVTVNGRPAEVLAAVGYPGAVDGYLVNFRIPPDTASINGAATIQISAAWISGREVRIPVQ
jgi:uncharacterized protein (TIGR03437 family)